MGLQRRETLTAQLARTLQERIAAGAYPVGGKLPSEQELIDEFGVSRTVVREAISSLRAGGVVTTQQGVGAFVSTGAALFSIKESELEVIYEVIAVLELRIGVETECAALAAQRRRDEHIQSLRGALDRMTAAIRSGEDTVAPDLDFHRGIAEATGNRHFLNLFQYLGTLLIPRARLRSATYRPDEMGAYLNRINAQHEDIFEAIVRQDSDAARAAMRLHLSNSRERLRASIEGQQPA